MNKNPTLIEFSNIGSSSLGFITVAEGMQNVPFEIRRVYWTYFTPNEVVRGGHAHKNLHQLIFAVSGVIEFFLTYKGAKNEKIVLNKPNIGLYIPPMVWREIRFSHSAVLLCLASGIYEETDYIRDFNEFSKLLK